MGEIVSTERQNAKAKGLRKYFTGKPCKNGHVAERNTSNGTCCECFNANAARFRARHPERRRQQSARYFQKSSTAYRALRELGVKVGE